MNALNESAGSADSEMLERALDALERLQSQLERERAALDEPIAIVGLGCRFPGADGADAFADFLARGGDAVGTMSALRAAHFGGADAAQLRQGGFFDDVAGFDAGLFELTDAEALAMDPHQRMLLEVGWQALEDAGAAGGSLAGSNTGVYLALGAQNADYGWWQLNDAALDRHAIAGSFHSLMPGRLSYLFDLRGPSMVVDAACASALAAVHLACQALRRRECDAALAAAVNLVLSPLVSRAVQRNGLWSSQGRCRSFDAAADGFVRGEGCGVLVLKRLSDALEAGDAIRAVIHGGAVGQDGRSNGLTAPNGPAQEAVMRRALAQAALDPGQVGYVEAHATGTLLGDAIEAEALVAVYGAQRAAPLLVGAVKPNLGHLEAAAGMAGLIKTVLALQRGHIAPTLHYTRLNPDIAAGGSALAVVTRALPWPAAAPYAGVSAFGMSGTNAHLIVGPAPAPLSPPGPDGAATLWLGANEEVSLRLLAGRLAAALTASMRWPEVCASLNAGRRAFRVQVELSAGGLEAGRQLLLACAAGSVPLASECARVRQAPAPARQVRLPTYPLLHRRFWPAAKSAMAPAVAAPPAPPALDAMLGELKWENAPGRPGAAGPGRTWLVTGSDSGVRLVMGALSSAGVVRSSVAPALDAAGWTEVLEGRAGHDLIYVVNSHAGQPDDGETHRGALASLLALVTALDGPGLARRLVVLTWGAWQGDVQAAMAVSLGRSAALEHPELDCRCIDIDADMAEPGQALADQLARTDGEQWVRLCAAGVRVPRVAPLQLVPHRFVVKPAACYLITGGFGGIGRALAAWLVALGARDLMLVGRHVQSFPEAEAWRAGGVRVRAVAADVADLAAMQAAFAALAADGVALAGVFHAAGIQDDALLCKHAWPDFEEVLRAKVDGAQVLDDLTGALPLDAFVLFSSVSALFGLVGAGAYAAANAALGALARRRRAQGRAALSVMWGTWEGSGMSGAAAPQLSAHWDHLGLTAFSAARGTAALEALLGSSLTEAVAADIDWSKLARWAAAQAPMFQYCLASQVSADLPPPHLHHDVASPAPDASEAEPDLDVIVRECVAAVLGLRPDDPALDRPFGELGLNSLAAIELRAQLSTRLAMPVAATIAFNYPSVYAIEQFLSKRLAKRGTSQPP